MSLNTGRVEAVIVRAVELRAGDRVKIQPKHDEVFSGVSLKAKIGVIEAFEQDAENRVHVALVLEGEAAETGTREIVFVERRIQRTGRHRTCRLMHRKCLSCHSAPFSKVNCVLAKKAP